VKWFSRHNLRFRETGNGTVGVTLALLLLPIPLWLETKEHVDKVVHIGILREAKINYIT